MIFGFNLPLGFQTRVWRYDWTPKQKEKQTLNLRYLEDYRFLTGQTDDLQEIFEWPF